VASVLAFERVDCWVGVVVDGFGEVRTWEYVSVLYPHRERRT
jgi:hypothetical protein